MTSVPAPEEEPSVRYQMARPGQVCLFPTKTNRKPCVVHNNVFRKAQAELFLDDLGMSRGLSLRPCKEVSHRNSKTCGTRAEQGTSRNSQRERAVNCYRSRDATIASEAEIEGGL